MSKVERFEDLIAWQKARDLAVVIYSLMQEVKDYSFRDQLQRAAISVSNNIAEGFERRSNKEFKQFLFIAKGSCGEVRSMLEVGANIKIMNKNEEKEAFAISVEVSCLLSGLIKKL